VSREAGYETFTGKIFNIAFRMPNRLVSTSRHLREIDEVKAEDVETKMEDVEGALRGCDI
jgi:hypothetical protein